YDNLDQVAALPIRGAKSLGAKLEEHREAAFMSYELATIKIDVPLDVQVADLMPGEPHREALIALYRELEFKQWLDELLREAKAAERDVASAEGASIQAEAEYETILEQADLDRWLAQLQGADCFAFDTETTSIDALKAQLVGLSFAVETGKAAYVPLGHSYMGVPQQLDRDSVLAAFKPLLEDEKRAKICQHGKYDMNVLMHYGIEMRGMQYDTMLESYVLDATATRHDMDSLALKYLGRGTIRFEDIAGKGAKQLSFNQIAIEQAGTYAAEDADITLRLHQTLLDKLSATPSLRKVLDEIEMPLVPVLARIERNGALVDAKLLGQQSVELGEK